MMGNKLNQISVSWLLFQVIVFLCLIEILVGFVEAKAGNGIVLISQQQDNNNAPSSTTTTWYTTTAQEKSEETDENANLVGNGRLLHNANPSFSSKIDDVSKSRDADAKKMLIPTEEALAKEDYLIYNSVKFPSSSSSSSSSSSVEEEETEGGMEINDNLEKWMRQLGNSNKDNNSWDANNVITQAFKFVKLDSHLGFLVSQLTKVQSLHESMQNQITRQDTKFNILMDQIQSLVNSVSLGGGGPVNVNTAVVQDKIEGMNQRLDRAVEKIIQFSTTSHTMFELSKESILQMDKMEMTSKQVLNEVQAVKTELGDVGQVSLQTIYNLNKLEENLMVGLEKAGNRTVYALRQDAKIIGPTTTVLLKEAAGGTGKEDGYEGNFNSLYNEYYQADRRPPPYYQQQDDGGSGFSSVKKLSLVGSSSSSGGIIKAESLVSCCLSRRLINEKRPKDCGEIQLMGQHLKSGVYKIFPSIDSDDPAEVYCDLETDGGGWTVFQRRTDSQEKFYRTWKEYEAGFGSPHKQYWLGLEKIAQISQFGDQELRVEMSDWTGEGRNANYGYFRVENSTDKYRLHVADYSGSAGDSLSYHNAMPFSTFDQDNDMERSINCAERYQGAWWYKNCHQSNLNGVYMGGGSRRGKVQSYGMGINWYAWHGYYYSIQRTEMKIRSRYFCQASSSPK